MCRRDFSLYLSFSILTNESTFILAMIIHTIGHSTSDPASSSNFHHLALLVVRVLHLCDSATFQLLYSLVWSLDLGDLVWSWLLMQCWCEWPGLTWWWSDCFLSYTTMFLWSHDTSRHSAQHFSSFTLMMSFWMHQYIFLQKKFYINRRRLLWKF